MAPKAQLPPLTPNEQRAAARASRERAGDDRRPLLTVAEAAAHLKKSTHTVYREIRLGRLRASRIGGHLRIRPSDLSAYFDDHIVS